jgi:uncharacterized protein YbjT (DUF2867 family)
MRVALVGGTGVIGSAVVRALLEHGHEVAVLSRSAPRTPIAGTEHRPVDLRDGARLGDALREIDVVVDAANGPASAKATATLVDGTRRLLEAGRAAGVGHHVTISIVGCERVPTAYYRVKTAQEGIVSAAPHGWSIVRATQLHGLLDHVFAASARYGLVPAPRGRLQPVDTGTVAAVVAQVATGTPLRDRVEVTGPEIDDIGAFARTWRSHRGSRARVARIPLTPALGRALREGALTAPGAECRGGLSFAQWLTAVHP